MNQNLALRVLGNVMNWDESRSREEFNWLRTISRFKYDGYRGFLAGARFVENLVYWLQQFDTTERETAYGFVRRQLVYVSSAQMEHLVDLFYPETVQRRLLKAVSDQLSIPVYRAWALREASEAYYELLRKTLFLGLSDGAQMDVFRRANAGRISNEQVVIATEISPDKWTSLLSNLKKDSGADARFAFVFLIDDFTASGTNLLRKQDGHWQGKLHRFWRQTQGVTQTHFADQWVLCIHHYIGTSQSKETVSRRNADAEGELTQWFPRVEFSFGTTLSDDLRVCPERHGDFIKLIDGRYNPSIETHHFTVGGDTDVRLGFGQCALPLVLEHNTPNNSIALLWAVSEANDNQPEMRPLFERRQRHI